MAGLSSFPFVFGVQADFAFQDTGRQALNYVSRTWR
jgi:hypothetical protein